MNLNGPISTLGNYIGRLAGARSKDGVQAEASIGVETAGEFDPDTGEYADDTIDEVWSGPVLVRAIGADQVNNFGDGPVSVRAYEIDLIDQTKASAAVQPEHVVAITSTQPDVNGLTLRVLDAQGDELSAHVTILAEERQDG